MLDDPIRKLARGDGTAVMCSIFLSQRAILARWLAWHTGTPRTIQELDALVQETKEALNV